MLIPLWLTVGIIAGVWMPISGFLGVAPWPPFIAWAAYFFAGADMNAMKKVYPTFLLGVLCGYVTILLSALQLVSVLGAVGLPLLVGIFAAILVFLGKFNIFSLAPAGFLAFATYFGTGLDLKATLIGLIIGPIFGIISVKATTVFKGKDNSSTQGVSQ